MSTQSNGWTDLAKALFHLSYVVALIAAPISCFRHLNAGVGAADAGLETGGAILLAGWAAAAVLFVVGKCKK
jgi:hypothetical protein